MGEGPAKTRPYEGAREPLFRGQGRRRWAAELLFVSSLAACGPLPESPVDRTPRRGPEPEARAPLPEVLEAEPPPPPSVTSTTSGVQSAWPSPRYPQRTLGALLGDGGIKPGGANYVMMSTAGYRANPSEASWYAPGSLEPPVGWLHTNPALVTQQLAACRAAGQRALTLMVWFAPLHTDVYGHVVNSSGGALAPQHAENLQSLVERVADAGFSALVIRFATQGGADPLGWAAWDEARYQENWAFIRNARALADAVAQARGLPVIYDLGAEAGGLSFGQNPTYMQRLWDDHATRFGVEDTYGFSFALAPGRVGWQLDALPTPGALALDVYDDAPAFLAAAASELAARGKAVPVVIQETFFNDAQANAELRGPHGLDVRSIFQWPMARGSGIAHFSMDVAIDYAAYLDEADPEVPRLELVGAYWAGSEAYGNHLAELPAGAIGHVDLPTLAADTSDAPVILDLHWHVFDYATHQVRADLDAQLEAIAAVLVPKWSRVRALYLIDEPYVGSHAIPRAVLEQGIARVKARFPGLPTYITFAHDCFDPSSVDAACAVPAASRGVPAGLDWAGFDHYVYGATPAQAREHVRTTITRTLTRLEQLAPAARVVLVPESFATPAHSAEVALEATRAYAELAAAHPRVIGVDAFIWADHAPAADWLGARSLPAVATYLRALAARAVGVPAPPPLAPPATPVVLNAGQGCDDLQCLWIIVRDAGASPRIDVRSATAWTDAPLASYEGATLHHEPYGGDTLVTLRLASQAELDALWYGGIYIWAVNPAGRVWSDPYPINVSNDSGSGG